MPRPGLRGGATTALLLAAAPAIHAVVSFAFLSLTAAHVDPVRFAPLSVLWSLQFVIGTGVFLPLEQEAGRWIARLTALGRPVGAARAAITTRFTRLFVGVLVALLAAAPLLIEPLFDGAAGVYAALVVGVAGFALAHLARGFAAGSGRLTAYGAWFVIDAALKAVALAPLVAGGADTAAPYALAFTAAPLLAAVAVLVTMRSREPRDGDAECPPYAPLLAASLLSAVLINGGPLLAGALAGEGESAVVSRLLTAIVLTRAPLLLAQAVQSVLLARITARLAVGDRAGVRRTLVGFLGALGTATVLAAPTAAAVGPWAVRTFFGADYSGLTGVDLALLTTASMLLIGALWIAQVVIAAGREALLVRVWAAGVLTLGAVTFVPVTLELKIELAMVASSLVALLGTSALALTTPENATADRPEPAGLT